MSQSRAIVMLPTSVDPLGDSRVGVHPRQLTVALELHI